MRRLAIIGVLSACLLGGAPLAAMADEKTEKALEERIKKLEKMVEVLTMHEAKEAKEEGKEKDKEKAKETKEGEKPPAYTLSGAAGGKSIYAKPFVSAPKATVGGYMDLHYRLFNSSNGTGESIGRGFLPLLRLLALLFAFLLALLLRFLGLVHSQRFHHLLKFFDPFLQCFLGLLVGHRRERGAAQQAG